MHPQEYIHENVDIMAICAYLGGSDEVQLGCRRERRHGEEQNSLTLSAILSVRKAAGAEA
jgi:hypothetical protein